MPERRRQLEETLERLDEELELADDVDEDVQDPLHAAVEELRTALEEGMEHEDHQQELAEQLGDVALRLEVSHPRLTELLNQISETLAGAGI